MNFTQVREYIRDLLAASFTNKQKLDKIDEDNNGFLVYNNTPVNSPQYGFTPVGTVISLMGNTAPANYLICDGTVYNIADYRALANYFEEQFGTSNYFGGDGTTTFAVPDLRGEFLRGTGTNSHTNQGNGANVGVHQNATEHFNIWVGGDSQSFYANGNINIQNSDSEIDDGTKRTTASASKSSSTWSSSRYTSRPTNTSVLYCIATKNIYMGSGGGSNYTAGDGIDITDNTISVNEMPSTDMSEIIYPKPTIPTRKVKYSTEEQVIGEWVDGKPLYQRTIHLINPNISWSAIDIAGLENAENCSILNAFFKANGYNGSLPWYVSNTNNGFIFIFKNSSSTTWSIWIKMVEATLGTVTDVYCTIQYTKTTD